MNIELSERSNGNLSLFILEGTIDELIEYLESKKAEGFTAFEVIDNGFRGETDYVLSFS